MTEQRKWDSDGYHTIPRTPAYPGMVAKRTSDPNKDIVVFGDPVLGRAKIEEQLSHLPSDS